MQALLQQTPSAQKVDGTRIRLVPRMPRTSGSGTPVYRLAVASEPRSGTSEQLLERYGISRHAIEQAVLASVFEALTERRPMVQQDLMAAISRTVPLSVTMAEQIKKIEAWAFKRAVPAAGKYNP